MCANAVSPLPTPEAHSHITKIDTAHLVRGSSLKFDTRHGVFRCTATRSPLTLLTNSLLAGSSDMRGWGGRVPLWGSLANRHIFRMRARWRSGHLGERRPERGRFRIEAGAAVVLRRLEADHRPGGLSLAAGTGGPAVHLHVLW